MTSSVIVYQIACALLFVEPAVARVASPVASPSKPADLDSVSSAWRARESAFATGEIQWEIRRDGFALFGGSPLAEIRAEDGRTTTERLLVDGARYRFDGWRTARISIGLQEVQLSDADEGQEFRTLLAQGRLPEWGAQDVLLPFTVWHVDGRRTCLWKRNGGEYPRSLIESVPYSKAALEEGGQDAAVSTENLLFGGIMLSVRPLLAGPLAAQADRCRVLPDGPTLDKNPCIVLEERLDPDDDSSEARVRHFWLDPRREFVVVRVIERSNGTARSQIDIRYAQGPDRLAMPIRWVAMTLNRDGDVTSYIYADRTAISGEVPNLEERFRVEFPPDVWVVDRVSDQSYIVKADGSRAMLNGREFLADARYEELLTDRRAGRSHFSIEERTLRKMLRASITGPGMLVTVACFAGLVWGVRWSMLRRRRSP